MVVVVVLFTCKISWSLDVGIVYLLYHICTVESTCVIHVRTVIKFHDVRTGSCVALVPGS